MEQTTINMLTQLIGSLGFPIIACIYMAWIHNDAEKRHSDERAKMTEALTKMNVTLEHINSIIEREVK